MKDHLILIASVAQMLAFGRSLGRSAQPGDMICLIGDLGAGKTLLTQGIGAGLDLPPSCVICSPTFILVAEYGGGRLPLYHFDLYRLDGIADLTRIGADDYFEGDGLTVIEWADRATDALPKDRLEIRIEFGDEPEERRLVMKPGGPQSKALIESTERWNQE